jgi:hypothetical protein
MEIVYFIVRGYNSVLYGMSDEKEKAVALWRKCCMNHLIDDIYIVEYSLSAEGKLNTTGNIYNESNPLLPFTNDDKEMVETRKAYLNQIGYDSDSDY